MATGYTGKFSPISDESDFITVENKKKRKRHSTGATLHDPTISTGDTGPSVNRFPSKTQFASLNMEEKMNTMFEMMVNISSYSQSLNHLNSMTYFQHAVNEVSEARLRVLEYKSLDIETKLLRNNLVISGLSEIAGDEDCLQTVTAFLENKFGMSNVGIVEANRIGRRQVARGRDIQRCRSILVKFCDQRDVENIMSNVRQLRNTQFGISRDYPLEIREARKQLWPDFKRARDQHGHRNVKFLFPAAIKINGEITHDIFPGWHSVLRGSRNSNVKARVEECYHRVVQNSIAANKKNDDQTTKIPVAGPIPQMETDIGRPEVPVVIPLDTSALPVISDEPDNESSTAEDSLPEVAGDASTPVTTTAVTAPGYLLSVHLPIQQSVAASTGHPSEILNPDTGND